MSLPVDFHGRNLVHERLIALLGRITDRAFIWLGALAFLLLASHAGLQFFSWPEPTTELTALESRAVEMEIDP